MGGAIGLTPTVFCSTSHATFIKNTVPEDELGGEHVKAITKFPFLISSTGEFSNPGNCAGGYGPPYKITRGSVSGARASEQPLGIYTYGSKNTLYDIVEAYGESTL